MGTITRSFANNITSGGTFDATDLTGTIPASNIADASVTNITAVPALTAVSTVASDPPSPDAGQVWYNTTDKALRAYVAGAGSWATGNPLNTGRSGLGGSSQSGTAALAFGGQNPPMSALTESYNGTSWTEVADLNTAKSLGVGSGASNTSALYSFGESGTGNVATNESWNGSSWTEITDGNTARRFMGGGGTQTSAIVAGGFTTAVTGVTETWNGSSWTEVADLNTSRYTLTGTAQNNTNALVFAGKLPGGPLYGNTETWNGSSWTEVADLNTAREGAGGSGASNTSALAMGGEAPAFTGATEQWNGTSWTEQNDLNNARAIPGASGTTSSTTAFGGFNPGSSPIYLNDSEEWTVANVTTDLGVS